MWYDLLSELGKGKTTIYCIHCGTTSGRKKMMELKRELIKYNIRSVEVLSTYGRKGSKVAGIIARYDRPSVVIVRSNLQVAYSWFGIDLPPKNELVLKYNQIGG